MQPILFVTIFSSFVLLALLVKTLWSVVSDSMQNRTAQKRLLSIEQSTRLQLDHTLKRTYTVHSLNRRQTRWRNALVVRVVKETEDSLSFYLIDDEHEPLPASLPGQHILVRRPVRDDSAGNCRCYSLSDDCSAGHWRITVKKNSNRPESVSRWLHEEISVGDMLQVRGPCGAFFLDTAPERNIVLVSAGIGITPIIPMLTEAIRKNYRSIHCFSQFRDVAHMPFADSLLNLAKKNPQFRINIWISRFPKGVRESAKGLFFEGKFQATDLTKHQGSIEFSDYYLCGPEEWQARIRSELIALGVSSESVRYELFHQSEGPSPAIGSTPFRQHSIYFKQSRANARFQANQSSLLACAGQNNISMESGCRTGACGSCAVRLMRGTVRYTREPQFLTQESEILPCVCVPESDLEIDA